MMLAAYLVLSAAPCLPATSPSAGAWNHAVTAAPSAAPQALPMLHTEGTLPHQGIYDQSAAATRDFRYMADLAMAWRATGNRAALDRLATYLDAWTRIYRPSFNPIDETGLGSVIGAYALAARDLPAPVAARTRAFLQVLASGYLAAMDQHRSNPRGTWSNNWQSHRVKLATLAAAALGDDKLFARARNAFTTQLSINMHPDGEVIDFAERDALHYVTYDLEPLMVAAIAAAGRGEDWLHLPGHDGQTLAKGLDWLLPYADGSRHHDEFVHSTVRFDAVRAQAGLPGFAGAWDPHGAATLYWSATLLDPRFATLARTLAPTPPRWLWLYGGACGMAAERTE